MPLMNLPIGGGFYQAESLPTSAQRCVNWMPVIPQTANALSKIELFHVAGIKQFATCLPDNRGAHVMAEVAFFVNGNTLQEIPANGVAISRGTIEGAGQVSMADNGSKLVIVVPGGRSYVWDGLTLVEITDTDFRVSDTVSFKDGFFIFTASDGSVFFNSALNDPLNYRALDFGTAEIDPDKIVASIVIHNELFIVGTETIELFQNIGGADFPFQRIGGANIQKGAHAKFSIVKLDETFVFAGGGFNEKTAIWQVTDSSRATKISTAAIDNEIQKFTKEEIENSRAFSYSDRGNEIAVFTFESEVIPSRTFAYNGTTSKLSGIPSWFEFQSGVTDNQWRVRSLIAAYGKLLVGDTDGRVGELDKETFTEYGNTIARSFTGSPLYNQSISIYISKLILTMESGVGTSGQGLDPVVRMSFSDDGRTFTGERVRKIGKKGAFGQETHWRRLGRVPRFRVFKFVVTDPVKPIIIKLEAELSSGGPVG